MKYLLIIIVFFIVSCSTKQKSKENTNSPLLIENSKNEKAIIKETEIIETFVDSTKIGIKGKSKIKIVKHRVLDETYLIIKFYTKGPNYWIIQNTYLYETDALMNLNPNISDFNNDKLNDITFISGTAARGANEIRRLFIFDESKNELISIVNSQDYPNMLYNDELNCIDAFLIYGGSSTVFAHIKGDSLIEFGSVHNDNCRFVYEIDKNGKEKLLQKDTIIDGEGVYVRYKNFKPLKTY